jgi:predicted HD superfamily hydrolase involved in NAD metabolism
MSHTVDQSLADKYIPFLTSVLSPSRLQHSLGVMQVMGELAEIYDLDRTQALIAGLLHDAGRDLGVERQLALAEEAELEFGHDCERQPVYLHAPVSAYLVSKELRITDQLVLAAIATHSDGGAVADLDTRLGGCLQVADILAPIRPWKGMKKLKSLVYAGQLEQAKLLRCGWLMEYFQETGVPIHPNINKKFETLSARLDVPETFFERW